MWMTIIIVPAVGGGMSTMQHILSLAGVEQMGVIFIARLILAELGMTVQFKTTTDQEKYT